jgi:hypothetical protein
MTDSCLSFAKQETERLDTEIEVLQGKIHLHNETKHAWDTIGNNAATLAAYLDIANAETARLNGEIEAVQEEICRHTETKVAWDRVIHNARGESYISKNITYEKGEDGEWHLQRLDSEIEALQGNIRLHDETKDAWATIVSNTVGESQADCLDLANSETARLNERIETVQQEIRRRLETRNAWDTIMRNSVNESRFYQGAMYMRGWDGQWHQQQTQASESNDEVDGIRTVNVVTKVNSVRDALLNACEKTFRGPQKHVVPLTHGKREFQSLGLR